MANTDQRPNLDQKRAAFAWKSVEAAKLKIEKHNEDHKNSKDYKDYKNLAKGAPAMIMNNGLMQTLAFFRSKGKDHKGEGKWDHHDLLLNNLIVWLHKQCAYPESYKQLMEKLFDEKSSNYRRATEESMHLLRWLRQFADS